MSSSTPNNGKKNTRFLKYSAITGGLLLAPSWLTMGYTNGPKFAAEKDYPLVLRSFLCLPGVDVNKADEGNYTPLDWAARNGHTECVKLLIAAGADVNKANKWGETPLYEAAYWGHTECVELLIAAGADVNMADKEGKTPLDVAGTEEIKQLLRAAGAKE